MTFQQWLTEKMQEYYIEPQGAFYLDKAITEENLDLDPTVKSISYRRFRATNKPKKVQYDANNLEIIKVERIEKTVPVSLISAYLELSKWEFRGDSSQFMLDWEQVWQIAENQFLMDYQDEAELGFKTTNGEETGILNSEELISIDTPLFNGNPLVDLQLITQEDANAFKKFLTTLRNKVYNLSKRSFKADAIIFPTELMDIMQTAIPFYAGGDVSGEDYLISKGVEVNYSDNANRVAGGVSLSTIKLT